MEFLGEIQPPQFAFNDVTNIQPFHCSDFEDTIHRKGIKIVHIQKTEILKAILKITKNSAVD